MKDCLESLRRELSMPYEVIVVDNGSPDHDVPYIHEHFPDVILIASEKNLGFAGGNNLGVAKARGQYLLLLNNDTMLETDIAIGIDLIESQKDIYIVGARMLGKNGEHRLSCGHFPEPTRLIKFASLYDRAQAKANGNLGSGLRGSYLYVDWVEGSFMLMPKLVYERLRGMDDGYFMYGEDVDFCRIASNSGWKTVYCPDMVYTHYGGYEAMRMALLVNGFRRYHRKHSSTMKRIAAELVLDVGLSMRVLSGLPSAMIGNKRQQAKVKACFNALMRKVTC
jgi:GT2 family glycosyltransferase